MRVCFLFSLAFSRFITGFKKLVYLTNFQANLVASDIANVNKLLDAFDLHNCKLVIRFLPGTCA